MKPLRLVRLTTGPNSRLEPGGVLLLSDRGAAARPAPAFGPIPIEQGRRSPPTWRRWVLALLLVGLPLCVYWPAVFAHYGFRDDYAVLRESHEEPGKVFRVCAMQARPLDGLLMELSFRRVPDIAGLAWVRFVSALLAGSTGAATFLTLRRLKWDRWTAVLIGAILTVLPSTQIVVGWAVGWPLWVALLLGLAGFVAAEQAFAARSSWQKAGWWIGAVLLVAGGALIYQSNSLFYFSAVAAGLWPRRRWGIRRGIEWMVRHVATVGVGMGVAFTMMMVAFSQGWVPVSRRVALEHDWLGKLAWFVREPLQNALGLVALNDDDGSRVVHRVAAFAAVIIIAGCVRGVMTRGWRHTAWWTLAMAAMLFGSFAVNFVVADRWPVYRVLLPLTATVVIAVSVGLLALGGRRLARLVLLAVVIPGMWLARGHTRDLIAWPQGVELDLLAAGAAKIHLEQSPRVFVLTPTPDEHISRAVFSDEFGSLSTDSDWVPKEMLKLIMRERYPDLSDVTRRYTAMCGRRLPVGQTFDVVIDLRSVHDFRSQAPE